MPVGAALGAAGVGSALIGSSAAKSAAKTQATAANDAAQMQLQMFNQIRDDLSPYRTVGTQALPGVLQLLGLSGGSGLGGASSSADTTAYTDYVKNNPDLLKYWTDNQNKEGAFDYWGLTGVPTIDQFGQAQWAKGGTGENRSYTPNLTAVTGTQTNPTQSYLESLPGYQFTKQQGLQAVENSLNSRGLGGLSGSLGKGIARFVTGLADQTYQQQLGNLMNLVNTGQNAATQTGTFGTQAATNAGSSLIGGANASAAGTVGSANAISGGLNNTANAYLTSRILGMYGA